MGNFTCDPRLLAGRGPGPIRRGAGRDGPRRRAPILWGWPVTLRDVLRALSPGGLQGGPCRDTDPILRIASGLPCGPVGVPAGAPPGYVQRTMARRAAMQQLDGLCFWHMLLIEIPPDSRAMTAARRELHVKLRNAQLLDDLEYAKAVNTKTANGG